MGSSLEDLQLADYPSGQILHFVDAASPSALLASIVVYFAFVLLQLVLAFASPRIWSYHHDYYPINVSETGREARLDLTFDGFSNPHRALSVNCSFLRHDSFGLPRARVQLEISTRIAFVKGFSVIRSFNVFSQSTAIDFSIGSTQSLAFPIFNVDIDGFDRTSASIGFSGELTGIPGCFFHWLHIDPTALRFSRCLRLFSSVLIAYFFTGFLRDSSSNSPGFTAISCLILGVAGVIAGFPLTIFLAGSKFAVLIDTILLFSYLGMYRFFCLTQLSLTRGNGELPPLPIVLSYAILCFIHAFADGVNSYSHSASLDGQAFDPGLYGQLFLSIDIVYDVVVLLTIRSAGAGASESFLLRVVVLSALLFWDAGASWLGRLLAVVWGGFLGTIGLVALKSAGQLAGAALWLFLVQPDTGPEYHEIRMEEGSTSDSYSFSDEEAPKLICE
jgi:hypothetical protein